MPELLWDGKYDSGGRKSAPLRVSLPFQTVESVNECAQERQRALDFFARGRDAEWRNRLIWGDKKYILPALVDELAGKVDLIYIDPPFFTGDDFTLEVKLNGDEFVKEPSAIERKAYRDTWGVSPEERRRGVTSLDKYLAWFYETAVLLVELLSETGSLFVHLDWHVGHYAKAVLDEILSEDNFRNEIVWHYYNKLQGNVNRFASNHDVIFWYTKGEKYTFHRLREVREKPKRQQKRAWDPATQTLKQARDEAGELVYYTETERTIDDVWRIPYLMPADRTELLGYPTQKRRELLDRIVQAASNEGDLVLDCFVGSGTTAEAADVHSRRWIACDLSRFAVHMTRKRLLSLENVQPFVVQNLGKYERQLWQASEFGAEGSNPTAAYRTFILEMYKAAEISGYTWLHGLKGGRMVHVGTVDAPVTVGDVKQIAIEFKRAIGSGKEAPKSSGVDVLGWDFAFELNEVAKQEAAEANILMRFVRIPREVLDKRAVEQGDIRFFELAALSATSKTKGRTVSVRLTNFMIPLEDVPEDAQVKSWTQWIDYWAIDWDNRSDTFHNEWQAYRTREHPELETRAAHEYAEPGTYAVVVKVIDILGNDTTKTMKVKVS